MPITCLGRAKYVSESLSHCELMAKYKMVVLACQVGPFHLKFNQINSEINCIAKHKITESQKLDTKLERHTIRVKSNTLYFCILCLCIILCDTRKASEKLTAKVQNWQTKTTEKQKKPSSF